MHELNVEGVKSAKIQPQFGEKLLVRTFSLFEQALYDNDNHFQLGCQLFINLGFYLEL